MSLSTHAVVTTIATSQTSNGTGVVQSIGLSPDGNEVLAVLNGLNFPGDVMATINTVHATRSASTVSLETGTDAMGQLVSDDQPDYVWVTDETNGGDVVQNLNLAVSDPASQPVRHRRRRHLARTRDPDSRAAADRAGLERRALLLGGCRRWRDLGDLRHALVPAGAGDR